MSYIYLLYPEPYNTAPQLSKLRQLPMHYLSVPVGGGKGEKGEL